MNSDKMKKWIDVCNALVSDLCALVLCPECSMDNLKVIETKLMDTNEKELLLYCSGCGAKNYVRKPNIKK